MMYFRGIIMSNIRLNDAIVSAKNFLNGLYMKKHDNLSVEEVETPKSNNGGDWVITLSWEEPIKSMVVTALPSVNPNPTKTVYKVFHIDENGEVIRMINRKSNDG